jgi:hypothetical protein
MDYEAQRSSRRVRRSHEHGVPRVRALQEERRDLGLRHYLTEQLQALLEHVAAQDR